MQLAARGPCGSPDTGGGVRDPLATAIKDTVVRGKVTDESEVVGKPGISDHTPGVATYREDLSCLNLVVAIEIHIVWMVWDSALVDDSLAIVLAVTLKTIELPEAIRGGVEVNVTDHPVRRHDRVIWRHDRVIWSHDRFMPRYLSCVFLCSGMMIDLSMAAF